MKRCPLPLVDGIPPTRVVLRGRVDSDHVYVAGDAGDSPFAFGEVIPAGTQLRKPTPAWFYQYYPPERPVPFDYEIVHHDEHLLVVDKPHFLPSTTNGAVVRETVQTRLRAVWPDVVVMHRLDVMTAGVLLCSVNPDTRGLYQSLFEKRLVHKRYEALVHSGATIPEEWSRVDLPMLRTGRRVVVSARGRPTTTWWRRKPSGQSLCGHMQSDATDGVPAGRVTLVELRPVTGYTHQLRVMLNHLGTPIVGDDLYPIDRARDFYDFSEPMRLLAASITFTDPISGQPRCFQASMR